jgi:hypothetical protein
MVMGHVCLSTKDWFDSLLDAFFVELDDAIHVAVISDTERLLTIRNCLSDQFIKTGCPIEHGIFSMNVEVCK